MIKATRSAETVRVSITLRSIGWSIYFLNKRDSEFDAVLLERAINEDLRDFISDIRREAYEDGWRDKASKKVKKRDFHSGLI